MAPSHCEGVFLSDRSNLIDVGQIASLPRQMAWESLAMTEGAPHSRHHEEARRFLIAPRLQLQHSPQLFDPHCLFNADLARFDRSGVRVDFRQGAEVAKISDLFDGIA